MNIFEHMKEEKDDKVITSLEEKSEETVPPVVTETTITKDVITEEEQENEEDPISAVAKFLGYTAEDEEIKHLPKSPEGVAELTKRYANEQQETFLSNIEASFPEIYNGLVLASNGGDYRAYYKNYYSQVGVKEVDNDIDAKTQLTEFYKEKGVEEELIGYMLEKLEAEGKLVNKANEANKEKLNLLEQQRQKQLEDLDRKNKEQKAKDDIFIGKVIKTIDSKDINGIKLTPTEVQTLQKEILPNIQRTANGYAIKLDANDDAELVGIIQAFLIASQKGNLLNYLERKATTLKFHKENKNTKFSEETDKGTGNGSLGVFSFLKK